MKNKNLPILIGVLFIGLIAGALWGSKYGFSLKGPLAGSGMQSYASFSTSSPTLENDLVAKCREGSTIWVYMGGHSYLATCNCYLDDNGNRLCNYEMDSSSPDGRTAPTKLDETTSQDLVAACRRGATLRVWDNNLGGYITVTCVCLTINGTTECNWEGPPASARTGVDIKK